MLGPIPNSLGVGAYSQDGFSHGLVSFGLFQTIVLNAFIIRDFTVSITRSVEFEVEK